MKLKLQEARKIIEQAHSDEIRRLMRSLREDVGLNQLELAKLSGVPQSNIHRIEDGKQAVTPRTLMRLANAIQGAAEKRLAKTKEIRGSELFKAIRAYPQAIAGIESELERSKQELEQSKQELAAIEAAREKVQRGDVKFSQTADNTWHALVAVSSSEIERKRRQLAALENLQSIDDPIISELIESFRREIAEKDKQLEALSGTVEKNGRTA